MALTRIDGTPTNDNLTGTFLDELIQGYAGHDTLNGGDGNDQIFGGNGNDTLNGNGGNDFMQGGAGVDVLDGGDGIDTVDTRGYHLGYVINLATGFTNFVGETFVNFERSLSGNGNDEVRGNNRNNLIVLNGGDDFGFGANGADTLRGGDGNDRLNGGYGNDLLSGEAGADRFVFNTTLNASANVDEITDFVSGEDRLLIGRTVFGGLASGVLDAAAFAAESFATTASHRILFDPLTGGVFYDSDGNGFELPVKFAQLNLGSGLSAADITVI